MYSELQEGAVDPGAAAEAAAPIGPPALVAGEDAPDEQEVASAEATLAEDPAPAVVRRPTSLASLKAEIARAMQVAADRESERIDAEVGEEEIAQVETIYARGAAESAELSKRADEDVSLVNASYEDHIRRIREEADRQIDDRRTGLEQSLTIHGSIIEAEIESVHVAVRGYRASLGEFFGRLAEERDPGAIARLAGTLPDPPDLDEIRADARAAAMKGPEQGSAADTPEPTDESSASGNGKTGPQKEFVPVMDPGAVKQHAGTLSAAAILLAPPDPSAPSASQSSSSPAPSEGDLTASPSEALSSQGNVAVRLIRAFTKWSSPTGASGHQ